MDTELIELRTGTERIVDVTEDVGAFCSGRGEGLCSVFAPHATAGLALVETGARSEPDLVDALDRLFPRDGRYRHAHGSEGHGADHLIPAFVSPSLVVPVIAGSPALGTWQSIVLVDPNIDNPRRQLRLTFLTG